MVTFDDAYVDFARHAWPALRRHGVPTTLFVPTAYPDQPARSFWWDRLAHALTSTTAPHVDTPLGPLGLGSPKERSAAFSRLRAHVKGMPHEEAMALVDEVGTALGVPATPAAVLGWDALRALEADGVVLAAHSRTHPMLDRLDPRAHADEVGGSLRDLAAEAGGAPPAFAYPGGGVDAAVVRSLETAGVRLAFTTERGGNDLRRVDWLRLHRINVGRQSNLALVRAQLLPRYLAVSGR
jgi:peptidoglycan/xylan/chitin deacetylase (PgdA/CDA1 family)